MRPDARSATLVIVCGLPGSGKTTHARGLEEELSAVRFCPDEWMQAKRLRALGARVELHYLTAPTDVLYDRVQRRAMEEVPITREEVASWEALIDVPGHDEMMLFDRVLTPDERPAPEER